MWDTDKGKFERLCFMQCVCVGICVIHCFVCSMLAQTYVLTGAQTVNINSTKHNLSEVGSISATDSYSQLVYIMCLVTVTCKLVLSSNDKRSVSNEDSDLFFLFCFCFCDIA